MRILPLCVTVMMFLNVFADALTLEELQRSYERKCLEITAGKQASTTRLGEGYLRILKKVSDEFQREGNLDMVLLVNEQADAVRKRAWPLPALPAALEAKLNKDRTIYVAKFGAIEREWAQNLAEAADKMSELLDLQMRTLTKAGDLKLAQTAKELRARIEADPDVVRSREIVSRAGKPGHAKPALRLRRYGDNIEVLVRYDARGKVSMESPVENVREETGKKRERGETKATTLGEFVGAEGFKVDPFVQFEEEFTGKESGKMALTELIPDFGHEEDEERGVRLSFAPDAKNPHGAISPALPPQTGKGTFRISCRCFIPRSNKTLTGLLFVHGSGGPLLSPRVEQQGRWTDTEITTESRFDSPTLLFYLSKTEGKTFADAKGEYLVIRSLKVEHVKFTAYVCARYDGNGEVIEHSSEEATQIPIISNGELLN